MPLPSSSSSSFYDSSNNSDCVGSKPRQSRRLFDSRNEFSKGVELFIGEFDSDILAGKLFREPRVHARERRPVHDLLDVRCFMNGRRWASVLSHGASHLPLQTIRARMGRNVRGGL